MLSIVAPERSLGVLNTQWKRVWDPLRQAGTAFALTAAIARSHLSLRLHEECSHQGLDCRSDLIPVVLAGFVVIILGFRVSAPAGQGL